MRWKTFASGDRRAEQAALAEVVLIAADTFSSMLSAYRGSLQPPAGEELKEQIVSLTQQAGQPVRYKLQARFVWSEYEQMVVADALGRGETVYNMAFSIEPQCPMRGAAMQLIRNVLQDCGRLLAVAPDQSTLSNDLDVVEAAICQRKLRGVDRQKVPYSVCGRGSVWCKKPEQRRSRRMTCWIS